MKSPGAWSVCEKLERCDLWKWKKKARDPGYDRSLLLPITSKGAHRQTENFDEEVKFLVSAWRQCLTSSSKFSLASLADRN
jgi:hypothetical protein